MAKNLPWSQFVRNANKKAALYGLPGRLAIDPKRLCEPCHYCGDPTAKQWDHVDPLGRGGANDLANLVPCCASCNHKKSTIPLAEMGLYPITVLCGWCWTPMLRSRAAVLEAESRGSRAFVCNAKCAGNLRRWPLTRQLFVRNPLPLSTNPHAVYMRRYQRDRKLQAFG